jgi:hypothetical protein
MYSPNSEYKAGSSVQRSFLEIASRLYLGTTLLPARIFATGEEYVPLCVAGLPALREYRLIVPLKPSISSAHLDTRPTAFPRSFHRDSFQNFLHERG